MMLIDWRKFVVIKLLRCMRVASVFGLVYALVYGVNYIYNTLLSYEASVRYKLAHTSQVWSIEAVLNDSFDPVERRIYIRPAGGYTVTRIHRRSDMDPTVIQPRTDAPWVVHNRSAYTGGSFNFIVVTPYRYTESEIYAIKAIVNFYCLAGKRYDIISES